MVEFLVTAAAELILEMAFSLAANDFAISWGHKESLTSLHGKLEMIRAVLQDAERLNSTDAFAKEWMKQLRDVVSEADDLLDEVQYEVLNHEVEKRERFIMQQFFPNLKKFSVRREMGHKIEEINKNLSEILSKTKGKDKIIAEEGTIEIKVESWSPRPFTFQELSEATHNFHQDQILGMGGFGAVYRANFPNGVAGAVKRVSSTSQQGIREYKAEVENVSRSSHRNLVQLIGWCHEIQGELLLIYEFMANKSLDVHLFNSRTQPLPWEVRYKIVQGLAKALRYLHEECGPQCILHLDIKSSNVLLDSNFEPKLSDFGLSRLVDHDKSMELTVMAGTRGYLAPEILTGKVSTYSDVYSFGVVALELATGRKPIDLTAEEDQKVLVNWVQNLYKTGKVMEAVDPKLGDDYKELQVKGLIVVGLWCVVHDFRKRPSMREIVRILNNTQDPLLDLHIPTLVPDPVRFDFGLIRETSFGSLDLFVPMEMENAICVDPMVSSSSDTDPNEDEDQTYSPLLWRHVSFLQLWSFFIRITGFQSSQSG